MLIIGDETKHRGVPWVTLGLVLINVLAFLLQMAAVSSGQVSIVEPVFNRLV